MSKYKDEEEFIKAARAVHGNKYDYSQYVPGPVKSKVIIICPIHGEFRQAIKLHLEGSGCTTCARSRPRPHKRKFANKEKFIEAARKVHGDRYIYDKVELGRTNQKITITCPIHGDFDQLLESHIAGRGCADCGKSKSVRTKFSSIKEVINAAKRIHGTKYNYGELSYPCLMTDKVTIACPIHGEFKQTLCHHLEGHGCFLCGRDATAKSRRLYETTDDYLDDVKKVHGDKYIYPHCEITKMADKISIICPKHGEFRQTLYNHLHGQGCRQCSMQNVGENQRKYYDTSDYEEIALKVHGGRYSYPYCEVNSVEDNIVITCKEHGKFEQVLMTHLSGSGCPVCKGEECSKRQRKFYGMGDYLELVNKAHNGKYTYPPCEVFSIRDKISIICPKHGEFKQILASHLNGYGCYRCACAVSCAELEMLKFIKSNYVGKIQSNDRDIISPLEIDIYLPELKLGIEYHGLYWHSEEQKKPAYHKEKYEIAKDNGITLIQVLESEWLSNRKIVESRLLHFINRGKTIGARKCEVRRIDRKEIENVFLKNNHIQGARPSSEAFGLFYRGELVSIMTFGKSRFNKDYEWEMLRFCNKAGYSVSGGASRLFSAFVKYINPVSVISYSDNRWGNGSFYENLGFKKFGESKPNYHYFKPNERVLYSRQTFQKHKLKNVLESYNEEMSEHDNMLMNGYLRIYDAGNSVYVWAQDTTG